MPRSSPPSVPCPFPQTSAADSAKADAAQSAGELSRLLAVMARLRDPNSGCPWDLQQTYATIGPYTVEEAYEVADAIERGDMAGLCDEAGDLLFQIVYYAQMAREDGHFGFADIARQAADKMIHRHPNVFGDAEVADAQAQTEAWEAQKRAERRQAGGAEAGELDGVPLALPALVRAMKLSRRAAKAGFEWEKQADVWAKVAEETGELQQAESAEHQAEEFGDLLFALVNVARWMDIDPETALRRANDKFERRFRALEKHLAAQGRTPEHAGLAEMEAIWARIKQGEGGDRATANQPEAGNKKDGDS